MFCCVGLLGVLLISRLTKNVFVCYVSLCFWVLRWFGWFVFVCFMCVLFFDVIFNHLSNVCVDISRCILVVRWYCLFVLGFPMFINVLCFCWQNMKCFFIYVYTLSLLLLIIWWCVLFVFDLFMISSACVVPVKIYI